MGGPGISKKRRFYVEIDACIECRFNTHTLPLLSGNVVFSHRFCSLARQPIDKNEQLHGFPEFCKLEEVE